MKENKIYTVRFARLDEYEKLHSFMYNHWGKDHILTKSKLLFDFQHKGKDKYYIVVGYNNETNEIDGIWSLIPVSLYDSSLQVEGNYWGAILKVRDDVDNKEIRRLPFKLFSFILKIPGFRTVGFSGLGTKGQPFVNPLCTNYGVLNQYYIANPDNEYFVGKNLIKKEFSASEFTVKDISLNGLAWQPDESYLPKKSVHFFKERFEKHPIYKYNFWGIYKNSSLLAIWAYRIISVKGLGRVIRIVDTLGSLEKVGNIGYSITKLLKQYDAEYVDCLNYGIDPSVFGNMGFEKLDLDSDKVIVPNYFEPFEQRNVKVHFAYISKSLYVIFRADADQDRPSTI